MAHRFIKLMGSEEKNKGNVSLKVGVSGVVLEVFVRYLRTRHLSYDSIEAVIDYTWELIYLSDFFGMQQLFDLVAGVLCMSFHKGNHELNEDDYLYSFLYSVLYNVTVLQEKLLSVTMAIIGRDYIKFAMHPVMLTLKFVCPTVYERIGTLLTNFPNAFCNCQVQCTSSHAFFYSIMP